MEQLSDTDRANPDWHQSGPGNENIFFYDEDSNTSKREYHSWVNPRTVQDGACSTCSGIIHDYLPRALSAVFRGRQAVFIKLGPMATMAECSDCRALSKLRTNISTIERQGMASQPVHKLFVPSASLLQPHGWEFELPPGWSWILLETMSITYTTPQSSDDPGYTLDWEVYTPTAAHKTTQNAVQLASQAYLDGQGFSMLRSFFSSKSLNSVDSSRQATVSSFAFRLLNCVTGAITTKIEDPTIASAQYAALSYLWGPPVSQQHGTQQDVPQTIKDAMQVTRELGYRYLWVDRYCIDQNDTADKHRQIQNMHIIYSGASVTIIAAAGANPTFGLPGISRPLEDKNTFTIGDYTFHKPFQSGWDILNTSLWSSRAWTYQEGEESRNRLFFTDSQIFVDDRTVERHLRVHPLTGTWVLLEDKMNTKFIDRGRTSRYSGEELFYKHLSQYLPKQLSYESDRINAIAGVLAAFEAESSPIYRLWGLPCYKGQEAIFTSALSWRVHSDFLGRRAGFPSWCWSGWHVSKKYDAFDFGYHSSQYKHETCIAKISILVEEAPSVTCKAVITDDPFTAFGENWQAKVKLMKHVTSPILTITGLYHSMLLLRQQDGVVKFKDETFFPAELNCVLHLDQKSMLESGMELEVTGLLLGCGHASSGDILLLSRKGTQMERVGKCLIESQRGNDSVVDAWLELRSKMSHGTFEVA